MPLEPGFDTAKAHRYFSVTCFNKAWELIEKPDRTAEEDEQMIRFSQASLWHWTQREDCSDKNLSIAYWQLSRIYAIVGRADEALRYASYCLQHSKNEAPFFLGYAHEAAARAEKLAGNNDAFLKHRELAANLAGKVVEDEDRLLLLKDIETLC